MPYSAATASCALGLAAGLSAAEANESALADGSLVVTLVQFCENDDDYALSVSRGSQPISSLSSIMWSQTEKSARCGLKRGAAS